MTGTIGTPTLLFLAIALTGCATAPTPMDPMAHKVNALVDETTHAKTEANAFVALESLGPDAAPYLIGHLGDERPLPIAEMALANHAQDLFEGLRHYGPKVVHDALSALLNQITGVSFEFVYNGATEAQRKDDRNQWVDWCSKRYPEKIATCRNDRR
ncbi:hypothetical protein [Dyella mobilis]|uniref:HEAT repeat domain-containing protein n=1 Tax=Dyella mobilis TaxID=1849582 RepID=A0ABS2KA47_9GAMM|nr:hypothetical protein [Dyella mobilis]MBM7128062.1 hypothetical protein [Dyella mobilis]GLR00045.1 hypothetical protein GCM10007863_44640 [Dyella mobilis]